jgi:hypothetical protein
LDIIEMAKFQEPERVAQDKRKAEQKQRAAEEADLAKKKRQKKEKKKDGEEVEEEEEEISLTEPLIKALRGTEILTELVRLVCFLSAFCCWSLSFFCHCCVAATSRVLLASTDGEREEAR